jgi:hypothetical protein
MMLRMRFEASGALAEWAIAWSKSSRNCCNETWCAVTVGGGVRGRNGA